MIETIVQIAMGTVLICGAMAIGVSLLKMHRAPNTAQLGDLITSTNKKGRVYLDPRKCFEAGAFLTATWILIFITSAGKFSFEAFGLYMAVYTGARWLRDREKRLGATK
jgi:hypothetical protein